MPDCLDTIHIHIYIKRLHTIIHNMPRDCILMPIWIKSCEESTKKNTTNDTNTFLQKIKRLDSIFFQFSNVYFNRQLNWKQFSETYTSLSVYLYTYIYICLLHYAWPNTSNNTIFRAVIWAGKKPTVFYYYYFECVARVRELARDLL